MSAELIRITLAIVVGAHGVGHILFLVNDLGIADWQQSTRSWLLTNIFGDVLTRGIGSVIWAFAILGFVAVAFGMFQQSGSWRTIAIASSLVSAIGVILFWSNPVSSPAISALVFDIIVVVALLIFRFPPSTLIGPGISNY